MLGIFSGETMAQKGRPKEEGSHTITSLQRGSGNQGNESIEAMRRAHDSDYNLCSSDFWYWAPKYIRTDDEENHCIRYFPEFPYLKDYYQQIEDNQKTIVLKSRRLLISWIMVLRQLHQGMFAGTGATGSKDVFAGGIMSIGQAEAEHLMKRIHRCHARLPEWMKIRNPIVKDNTMYFEWEKGGTVQAFPMKREGPQTFGFTEVGFDEMALQEAVRGVWTGLMPTLGAKGKLLAVSTPNGRTNLFYDIWENKDNAYPKIKRIELHWRSNPEHDEAWFENTTAEYTRQEIARMFELSFAVYLGKTVWNKFDERCHVVKETEIYKTPMYIGWDLGYHYPAVTFWQRNTQDQWVGHREVQGFDISFDKFCLKVIEFANSFYDRNKIPEIHCLPHDAKNRYRSKSATGAGNDLDEIRKAFRKGRMNPQTRFGPQEIGTRNNEGPRMKETRKTFDLRADGEPGMYVNKLMQMFIEGCQGGYCYPDKNPDSEEPMKNEASHLQDSYQAVVVSYNRMIQPQAGRPTEQQRRRRIGGRTGL